jgi:DNA adenine methylase
MPRTAPAESLESGHDSRKPPRHQILKWIGNKQRFAEMITDHLPRRYNRYIEPFVGTGAVLAAMQPDQGLASDTLNPLIEFWHLVQRDPEELASHYESCWEVLDARGKDGFKEILTRYNNDPNPGDLLALSRSCYGGVVRFTLQGTMSTPMGPHRPIAPDLLRERLSVWQDRVRNTKFICQDYAKTLKKAGEGDVVYCDPPYAYSQSILYGAHGFSLDSLWESIRAASDRGANVALSLNGNRKNGARQLSTVIPEGIFVRELVVDRGGCMLRRFQSAGKSMDDEKVADRLLFTW